MTPAQKAAYFRGLVHGMNRATGRNLVAHSTPYHFSIGEVQADGSTGIRARVPRGLVRSDNLVPWVWSVFAAPPRGTAPPTNDPGDPIDALAGALRVT